MAASSVTGVGLGDSNGKQKPELHSGCGCCSSSDKSPEIPAKKRGCYFNYSFCNSKKYKLNSNFLKNKSCF